MNQAEILSIVRTDHQDRQTLGDGFLFDAAHQTLFSFKTLELAWKENIPRVSCIPEGTYDLVKHVSPKFGPCLWLPNVPGRSEVLVHPGNFYTQILGCILPGSAHTDINHDGYRDVVNSRNTMQRILELCPDQLKLQITSA